MYPEVPGIHLPWTCAATRTRASPSAPPPTNLTFPAPSGLISTPSRSAEDLSSAASSTSTRTPPEGRNAFRPPGESNFRAGQVMRARRRRHRSGCCSYLVRRGRDGRARRDRAGRLDVDRTRDRGHRHCHDPRDDQRGGRQRPQLAAAGPYLPTHWWLSFDALLRAPVDTSTLLRGRLSFAAYTLIFGDFAWARFTSADVTS
jgi:hypothetical protein